MSAGPLATAYLDEELRAVQDARGRTPGTVDPQTARVLDQTRAALETWRARAGTGRCDMTWIWRARRAWAPTDSTGCSRLTNVGWASGPTAALAPGVIADRHVARTVYWPAAVEPWRSSWIGPTYVLTDGRTYSAAEMFAAVLQDNGIATLVGDRTGGDGCGFLTDGLPIVLPHARLRFRVPDCVRLRADGADEVAGVTPSLPVHAWEGESARARARRVAYRDHHRCGAPEPLNARGFARPGRKGMRGPGVHRHMPGAMPAGRLGLRGSGGAGKRSESNAYS